MSILDRITGFSRYEQSLDSQLLSLTLESQRVRVFQSHRALWLVIASSLVYIYSLWNDAPSVNLVIWLGLVMLLAVGRGLVCRYVGKSLEFTSVSALHRNELLLYSSSILSTVAVGSGYWWVCLQGSDRAVFAESIRIRDENRAQNVKLEKDKLIIEKALNVARQANEEKNRFMAAASHDLRQPLHAMTLFLGSLRHMGGDERTREL